MNHEEKSIDSWVTACLYYTQDWNTLICNVIKPFVENILTQGLASSYFFIRYFNKGPHIRLRFQVKDLNMIEILKGKIVSHFGQYFMKNPSKRSEPISGFVLKESDEWEPNNTIKFIKYEPETERYLGYQGLQISHRQFKSSSDMVTGAFSSGINDYTRIIGLAVQINIGMCYSFNLAPLEVGDIFKKYKKDWLPYSMNVYDNFNDSSVNKRLNKINEKKINEIFQKKYEKQEGIIQPATIRLWELLTNGEEINKSWYEKWIQDMKTIHYELKNAFGSGISEKNKNNKKSSYKKDLMVLSESYIHMNNNRLGVNNMDEAFIAHIIYKLSHHLNSRT